MSGADLVTPVPGRELDAQVATEVMGCKVSTTYPDTVLEIPVCVRRNHECGASTGIPFYSTRIAAAWEVVEKIRAMRRAANESLAAGLDCETGEPMGDIYDHVAFYLELSPDCTTWEASIFDPPAMYAAGYRASTAPLAICLAALQAVGTPVPGPRTP